jgi:spore maturation protein CgeB
VIEAMAASVPSVSWLPPNRPECANLFADGEEVLLFDSVEKLAEKISMMRAQPEFRHQLVQRARSGLHQRHTSRIRCHQYGRWIDTAETPVF